MLENKNRGGRKQTKKITIFKNDVSFFFSLVPVRPWLSNMAVLYHGTSFHDFLGKIQVYTGQEGNCLRVRGIDVFGPKVKEMTSTISKNNLINLKPGNNAIWLVILFSMYVALRRHDHVIF